ncbi:suppressor of fused domain protein [Catenulispora yoronensis]
MITAVVYVDVPAPGYVTGFTYGLSEVDPHDGFSMGCEISMTVRSVDTQWAMVPASMVSALWGIGSFRVGRVIGSSRALVEGSSMTSVLLAESPDVVNGGVVPIDDGAVAIIGAYPIHASEKEFIGQNGFDTFWALTWDRYDPLRSSTV